MSPSHRKDLPISTKTMIHCPQPWDRKRFEHAQGVGGKEKSKIRNAIIMQTMRGRPPETPCKEKPTYAHLTLTKSPSTNLSALETVSVMAMDRAPPRILSKPPRDAIPMESTQALEPCHRNAHLELLETDRALRTIHAVLLRGNVRKHARPPRTRAFPRRRRASTISTVRGNARVNMCLPQLRRVCQALRWQLTMTDRAFVLLRQLRRIWRQRSPMRCCCRCCCCRCCRRRRRGS